jgi:shikimate kinase
MGTLWLVGLMGSGKSTVGPLVAARLGLPFIDLDAEVASAAGRSVAEVFAAEGEVGFRRREAAALATVAGKAAVVACGGGVAVDADNVARMRAGGRVIWLEAAPRLLAARVGRGEGRPLLGAGRVARRLRRLRAERGAAYAAAADRRVATDGLAPPPVAEEGVRWWNQSR